MGGESRGRTLGYKNDLLSITGLKKASYLSLYAYLSMIAAFSQIESVLQSFSRFYIVGQHTTCFSLRCFKMVFKNAFCSVYTCYSVCLWINNNV